MKLVMWSSKNGHLIKPHWPVGRFSQIDPDSGSPETPQRLSSSVPEVWNVTPPDLAIVCLRGGSRETWQKKRIAEVLERDGVISWLPPERCRFSRRLSDFKNEGLKLVDTYDY